MVIRERVFRVVQQFGKPVSTQRIARKMRVPVERLSAQVSKLHAYGYLTRVKTTKVKQKFAPSLPMIRHFYVPSGKPYEDRA